MTVGTINHPPSLLARLAGAARHPAVRNYIHATTGSAGRLVFALAYFVALANALSISDFGIFATASATGVMLSRIVGFGFVSPLYRIATVKPRLLGTYTAGYLAMAAASLPVLLAAAAAMHFVFFSTETGWWTFAAIIAAEALLWRTLEVVVIVNNGMGKFLRASMLVIGGSALRALAALVFWYWGDASLATWTLYYMAANAAALLAGAVFFYPWSRLRWRPRLYARRLPDAFSVGLAEILFYLQMELDKLVVLSFGGAHLAGIYAIVMRLADLTAIPVRSFNILLVQKVMKAPQWLSSVWKLLGIEAAILAVSVAGMAVLGGLLWIWPGILGSNVAQAAGLVLFALAIPAFRNLIEYQAELLYARGQTFMRSVNLAILAAAKAGLLIAVMSASRSETTMILWLNAGFAALYLVSAMLTYPLLRRPARRV